jgi:hypothetical protein
MSKVSPLAPLLDIHSLPLDRHDLMAHQVGDVTADVDAKFVQSFDVVWLNIMEERGSFTGTHESKIAALQNVAVKLKKSKDDVKSELKKQTLFVRNNRDTMEAKFKQQLHEVKHQKIITDEKFSGKKELLSKVTKSSEATMHWDNFMSELDRTATAPNLAFSPKIDDVVKNVSSYSDKAMRLVYLYLCIDGNPNDANQILHRATKVENALLKSRLKMLRLELDRCKAKKILQQDLGAMLKEIHNA